MYPPREPFHEPFPCPRPEFSYPLGERPPRRRRMTAISGFKKGNFVVLLADSQEVFSDYTKGSTRKINVTDFFGKWRMAVAGAGNSTFVELLTQELKRTLGQFHNFDYPKIYLAAKDQILRLHRQYIWCRHDNAANRPSVFALIVLQPVDPPPSPLQGTHLLVTAEGALLEEVLGYRSIGWGMSYADSLARRIFPSLATGSWDSITACTLEQLVGAGIFILREVKSFVQGCDGKTQVIVFTPDGDYTLLPTPVIEQWESVMSDFELHSSRMLLCFINRDSPITSDAEPYIRALSDLKS